MITITLTHYLILSFILFIIGAIGVVIRRNALIVFMSIELMLNAANIALIAFSRWQLIPDGQVVAFFVMAVAAAEAAIGLAIVIALFRNRETVYLDDIKLLKG